MCDRFELSPWGGRKKNITCAAWKELMRPAGRTPIGVGALERAGRIWHEEMRMVVVCVVRRVVVVRGVGHGVSLGEL